MLFSGQPQGRHYWDGSRFVMAPMPPQGLLSPQPQPSMQAPVAQQPQMQGLLEGSTNGGGNTIGGAPTSSAAAPAGFSTAGTPNPGQSPSVNGPSYSLAGGVAGGGLGLMAGVPGLGAALGAIGSLADTSRTNANLAAIGHGDKSVSRGGAAFSAAFGGLPDALGIAGPKTDVANMGIGFSPRGVDEMANFALGYSGMNLTGFDSPEMDLALGQMSPISAVTSPAGLLGGWGGLFGTPNDGSGLGGIGAGATGHLGTTADGREAGYGALGTPSSYGFGDLGGFGASSNDGGGGGMSGAAGDPGADGGPSGPWRKGGYTGDDGDGKLEPKLGVVHEREYVIRPEATAYYGKGLLKAINERRIPRGLFG